MIRIPNIDPYTLNRPVPVFSEMDPEFIDVPVLDDVRKLATEYADIDPEYKLSPHFKYKELIYSDTAVNEGINNNIPANRLDILDRASFLATNILEPIRAIYGPFSLNSWFRGQELEYRITHKDGFKSYLQKVLSTAKYNQMVKVLATSPLLTGLRRELEDSVEKAELHSLWLSYFEKKQHPNGEAVDMKIFAAGSIDNLYNTCKKLNKPFDQIILEFHKQSVPMSGWVHYSLIDESLDVNKGRKNRRMDFKIG